MQSVCNLPQQTEVRYFHQTGKEQHTHFIILIKMAQTEPNIFKELSTYWIFRAIISTEETFMFAVDSNKRVWRHELPRPTNFSESVTL
jgi:hypothetical protein